MAKDTSTRKTKDAYLTEALRLFADKGYEAVGVAEIAKAVGCTTSTLYKHYKGKQALFDAIIEKSKMEFSANMGRLRVDFDNHPEDKDRILAMTEEGQIAMFKGLFRGVAESEYPRLFRKLMTVEQYKHSELAQLYEEHYLNKQISAFESLMQVWIDGGVMRDGDARLMAVQYISPLILMIGAYDRNPRRKKEIMQMLESHVVQFNAAYRIS